MKAVATSRTGWTPRSLFGLRPAHLWSNATSARQDRRNALSPDSEIGPVSVIGRLSLDFGANVLAVGEASEAPLLQPSERIRLDEQDDMEFYSTPRMVHHADAEFRDQVTALYSQILEPGWSLLDMCASWDSHLPAGTSAPNAMSSLQLGQGMQCAGSRSNRSAQVSLEGTQGGTQQGSPGEGAVDFPELLHLGQVVGQGLNAEELAANPRLSEWFVQDLNIRVRMPLAAASFDAVLCCCGIQYLCHLEAVAVEVFRVLRPGGVWVVSFSSHSFAEKALVGWLQRSASQRLQLVSQLMSKAGFGELEVTASGHDVNAATKVSVGPRSAQALQEQTPRCTAADPGPFFCVVGQKPSSLPAASAELVRSAEQLALDFTSPPLREMDTWDDPADSTAGLDVSEETLQRWAQAYQAMAREAMRLGIPESAIPKVTKGGSQGRSQAGALAASVGLAESSLTIEGIREARGHLQNIMASFFSSGL